MLALPAPAAPVGLLCAVNPTPKPTHFFTVYDYQNGLRASVYGVKSNLTGLWWRALDLDLRVSAIIPLLPLSDNLKYRYSWRGGREVQELRKEYRESDKAA